MQHTRHLQQRLGTYSNTVYTAHTTHLAHLAHTTIHTTHTGTCIIQLTQQTQHIHHIHHMQLYAHTQHIQCIKYAYNNTRSTYEGQNHIQQTQRIQHTKQQSSARVQPWSRTTVPQHVAVTNRILPPTPHAYTNDHYTHAHTISGPRTQPNRRHVRCS